MFFSTTDIDKTYSYDDFLKRNRIKYYFLAVPVVALLAAAVYIFFIYDPSPSKDSNNGASMTLGEPKQIDDSPETGTVTVADAVEVKVAPETFPSAEESSDESSSNEESQAEAAASDEENSGELAFSDEAESAENFLSAAADDESTQETTLSAADDESTQETTLSAVEDDSTDKRITSAGVDISIEETTVADAVEVSIEDSSTEDITAKRVTYVKTDSFDSPQADSSSGDDSRETASPQPEMQSQSSIVADDQKQLSGRYIEHQAVITSSLFQAISDAGLSANQSARIGRIFQPYLDSRRELRKGDKLTILLDPDAGTTGNDADHVHRLEFHGGSKTLVITRVEGSLSDYEVRDADGKMLSGKEFQASKPVEKPRREVSVEPAPAVEKPRREASVETAPRSRADNNPSPGGMKRVEGVVTVTLFSAAREAGLNAVQLKKLEEIMTPYINFNKDVRKGDRIVIALQGGEIYSSKFIGVVKQLTVTRVDGGAYRVKPGETESDAHNGDEDSSVRKPFWKRLGFGSSNADEKVDVKGAENSNANDADEKVDVKGVENSSTNNADENSSAKKPFWKRWFKDRTEGETVLSNE